MSIPIDLPVGTDGGITLHHGSTAPFMQDFRPLTHFGTRSAATARALHQAHKMGQDHIWLHEARVLIVSPMDIVDIDQHSIIRMIDHLHYDHLPRARRFPAASRNRVFAALAHGDGVEAFTAAVVEHGHDGFRYVNRHEDSGASSFIILSSSQAVRTGAPVRMTFDEGLAIVRGAGVEASAASTA